MDELDLAVQGPQQGKGSAPRPARVAQLGPGAAKLAAAIEAAAAATGRRRRPAAGGVAHSTYRAGSWRAQTILHRSQARRRGLVSGRGVGKTHACAYELVQLVMDAPIGSEGAVLAPTLTHAEAAVAKLRQVAAGLPGMAADSWVQSKRRLMLPGGRSIKVFSADRKETVRGPSIVALWIDEAALVHVKAINASWPAVRSAVGVTTRLLISTTPAGKNWVWDWRDKSLKGQIEMEFFRFRATESPYQDPSDIELARGTMSPEVFAQEYLAEFVDNLLLVFADREGLFVDELQLRAKAACWLGVDLGMKDFTVCTLMNEWQEASIVGRWNEATPGFSAATYWAQTYERVTSLAKASGAICVVDTGGAGGAAGAVLAEHLRIQGVEVIEIKTSSQGTKAKIVEQAKADVQWKKLKILQDEDGRAKQLDYEMSKFQGIKRVHHGQELMIYEGPQVQGEHDDCVISFCLANWGRVRGQASKDDGDGDLAALRPASSGPARAQGRGVGGGGYIFR